MPPFTHCAELRLLNEDANREPLAAAVALLFATARRSDAPTEVIEAARQRARDLLSNMDWRDPQSWEDGPSSGPKTLHELAAVTSSEIVAARITNALAARPKLVRPILLACARWSEQVDRQTRQTVGFSRSHREEPTWLSISAIRAAAA